MKVEERFNKKLLVEGNDDQHVVWALCVKFKITENFDVIDCESIDGVKEEFSIRNKQLGTKIIGIIVDADTDLQARWNSLKNILVSKGFNIPDNLPKEGLIVENKTRKVGVWIMPDNNTNGMLEDFISFLVPEDDKLIPVVDNTLANIENQKLNKYSDVHKSKAKIHTWLAWQENPGSPMGQSITKRYLSTDDELCQNFVNWLRKLFN
ncbi:hypothetical protein FACS1894177_05560 [Bacteroidia bacterium]|nr:hypothetical protein FACS1894177_05560 [Bacteroidia bacterium]